MLRTTRCKNKNEPMQKQKIFAYLIIALTAGFVLYFIVSSIILSKYYDFEDVDYNHEIDYLFRKDISSSLVFEKVYRSTQLSAIYFIKYDSIHRFVVIEESNFINPKLLHIIIERTKAIMNTDGKMYIANYVDKFPQIDQVLDPRKSDFIKVLIQEPCDIKFQIQNNDLLYITGWFRSLSISNKQNISIISFQKRSPNELLIIKRRNKVLLLKKWCGSYCRTTKAVLNIYAKALNNAMKSLMMQAPPIF